MKLFIQNLQNLYSNSRDKNWFTKHESKLLCRIVKKEYVIQDSIAQITEPQAEKSKNKSEKTNWI